MPPETTNQADTLDAAQPNPPHRPRRLRQLRRVGLEFIGAPCCPFCTGFDNISARVFLGGFIKAGYDDCEAGQGLLMILGGNWWRL